MFTNEGEAGGLSRAADYLVLPRIYSVGDKGLTAQELLKKDPVEIIKVKGVELARIYKSDYAKIKMQKPIIIGTKNDWQIKMINNNPNFEIDDGVLKIDYNFTKTFKETDLEDNRFLLTNNSQFLIDATNKGIYLEVFGDGNDKVFSIVFTSQNNLIYLSYDLECDWQGWKKVFVPFAMFHSNQAGFNLKENPDWKYFFSLGVVSRKPISGGIQIKKIFLADQLD